MSKQDLYRGYVFAKCMEYGYNDTTLFKNDITIAVYHDLTSLSLVEYGIGKKLDSLAKNKVNSIEPAQLQDYEGKKPTMGVCIDYYDSKQLREQIKEIIKALPDSAKRRRDY